MTDELEATTTGTGDYRVLDTAALRALAHPLRVQIYDIISQFGPQTASTLATMTGESTGATSYHLRALAKQRLIREVEDRGTARERWWERPIGGVTFSNPDAMRTPAGRAATQVVMSEFYQRRYRQLMQYVEREMEHEPQDWQDAAMLSSGTARLTVEQLADLTHRLQDLIDETVHRYRNQRGEDVRPVTIRADVFPLSEKEH